MVADLIEIVVKVAILLGVVLGTVAYMALAERKISAFIQHRLGPNRVGIWGLLQPIADGIKFVFKEEMIPANVNRVVYLLAPTMILVPALMTLAVVPFGDYVDLFGRHIRLQLADLNIGILYILALTSLGVYGIVLGGWASNNKYSLLGGIRASSQMISYELTLGLSLIGVLMIDGSLRLNDIIAGQQGSLWGGIPRWNVFIQPLGFLLFLVASFAETNRLPFDLPECEQELVAGYHAEYSSLKFAMFYMAEYANMLTSSVVAVALFFGGWHLPGLIPEGSNTLGYGLLKIAVFGVKTAFFLFLFIWVRWTLPRFRYDQLMNLGWKVLLELAFLNVLATGAVLAMRG